METQTINYCTLYKSYKDCLWRNKDKKACVNCAYVQKVKIEMEKMNNENLKYVAFVSCQLFVTSKAFDDLREVKKWCIEIYSKYNMEAIIISIDTITDEVVDARKAGHYFDLTE